MIRPPPRSPLFPHTTLFRSPPPREPRPQPSRPEPEAPDEPGGAREARATKRAERLLRAMGQEHGSQRQAQRQQPQIYEHLATSEAGGKNNYSNSRYLTSNKPSNKLPPPRGSLSQNATLTNRPDLPRRPRAP